MWAEGRGAERQDRDREGRPVARCFIDLFLIILPSHLERPASTQSGSPERGLKPL